MIHSALFRIALVGASACCFPPPSAATDAATTSPTGAGRPEFAAVLHDMSTHDWAVAAQALRRHEDPASADWNALMGRAMQEGGLAPAVEFRARFDEALRLNPGYFGALQFQGESDLALGHPAAAEAALQRLGNSCENACAEYDSLKAATASYRDSARP